MILGKKILFAIIIFACLAIKVFGQNLVPNHSFESHTCCPQNIGGNGDFPCASQWIRVQCSPDYFNPCDATPNNLGVPSNAWGTQNPDSGVAYAGLYTFNLFQKNMREYIECQLSAPFISGHRYIVSFHVSLADLSDYSTVTLGAYFSSNQITGSNCLLLPYNAQVQNKADNPLNDKTNWILISDTVYATGGEQYLTIGNFMPDSLSDTLKLSSSGISSTYYYIDDVSIFDIATLGIPEEGGSDLITIYPNPADDFITISSNIKKGEIVIIDVLGNQLMVEVLNENRQIDITKLNSGVYFLQIKTAGKSRTIKFVKNKDE